jgi:hypothetical protein
MAEPVALAVVALRGTVLEGRLLQEGRHHHLVKAAPVVQDIRVPQWLVVAAAAQVQQVARLVVVLAVTEGLVLPRLLLGAQQLARVKT